MKNSNPGLSVEQIAAWFGVSAFDLAMLPGGEIAHRSIIPP